MGKIVYCESCGRRIWNHDGKSTINVTLKCKKCNCFYTYYPKNNVLKKRTQPERKSEGGVRLY